MPRHARLVRSARGRAQNKSNVVMKILAAHAVWSVILARRGRCADQSDRVEARYPAQRRTAPLFFLGWPGVKTRIEPPAAFLLAPSGPCEACDGFSACFEAFRWLG